MKSHLLRPISAVILGAIWIGAAAPAAYAGEPAPAAPPASAPAAPSLSFRARAGGEFTFDTGVLRGILRGEGPSRGLTSLVHVPTGKVLSRGHGIFGHYRVFTAGTRHGGGAWDWPSEGRLRDDGAVEVRWPPAEGRPFAMRAVYRWIRPSVLDLETAVEARSDLKGFESFLASYFGEKFTSCRVRVKGRAGTGDGPGFLDADASLGVWLMAPRDDAAERLIRDGRWKIDPNPVDWTILPPLESPIGLRREKESGVTAVILAPPEDCFAVATPHQAEGHYSLYFSLFGRDIKAGETARARSRLRVEVSPTDRQVMEWFGEYVEEIRKEQRSSTTTPPTTRAAAGGRTWAGISPATAGPSPTGGGPPPRSSSTSTGRSAGPPGTRSSSGATP